MPHISRRPGGRGPISDELPVRPPLDLAQPREVATATFALG
jgi:hypothetical protein